MKATAELKMLPVSVLKPAAYNPRKKLKPGDKEYDDVYVIRDSQKLKFEEVATFEPEREVADGE